MVKILTVLVSKISNSTVFLLKKKKKKKKKKNVSSFFSAKILAYMLYFNDTLTKKIVSFEQPGPGKI